MKPISSEDDLKNAIREAGRRADATETRAAAIGAAETLKLSDLIPDAWGERGELAEPEQRDTANDVTSGLESALQDALGDSDCSCGCDCYYLWVQDWMGGADEENPYTVIYQNHGDLYSAPFSFDDESKIAIDIEAAVKVRRITNFIERQDAPPEKRTAAWAAKERRKARAALVEGMPERRYWQPVWGPVGIETRSVSDGIVQVGGYASVTEVWYEVGDYEERAVRGCFKRTLGEKPDVLFLANHGDMPLARTKTNSLMLDEPRKGLQYEADLQAHDPDVQRLLPKLEREDMDESSFAFRVRDQEWDSDYRKRSLVDLGLHKGDVSVVNFGANDSASSHLRGIGYEQLGTGLRELRAGKALSTASMDVLTRVLELVADADDAVDEAQPLLADLMGVENPDDERSAPPVETRTIVPSYIEIAKAKRARAA